MIKHKQTVSAVFVLAVFAVVLMNAALPSNSAAANSPTHPNVVLIMADDLGYGDLSCYGSDTIKTPVLDKLASEGARLTSFYAGCTICTPSRMALLTGAYPARVGWRGGVVGYGVKPQNGLAPGAITIAEVFRGAGYQTALIGKWHLGDTPELSPMKQGFDTTFYINKRVLQET
jgi:arylsulfatase A